MFADCRKTLFALTMLATMGGMAEVVINEVCYKNDRFDDGTGTLTSDWVELYNNGSTAVDVGGYAIGKKKDYASCGDQLCVLPSYSLGPGEFLVVYFDKDLPPATTWVTMSVNGVDKSVPWVRSNAFNLGTTETSKYTVQDDVRLFDNTSAHNRLSNYKGDIVAALVTGKGDDKTFDVNTSCGYLWDGAVPQRGFESEASQYFLFGKPTPWSANAAGLVMSAPSISVAPGVYASTPTVKVTSNDGRATQIYYTLDGTDPRNSPTRLGMSSGRTLLIPAREDATAASGEGQTNAWIRTSPVELESRVPGAGWQPPIGSVSRVAPLRAVAAYGPAFSAEAGGDYCIGPAFAQRRLPIVSLRVEWEDFLSDAWGVYVPGDMYKEAGYGSGKWGKPNANYFADDTEVPANLSLLEPGASHPAFAVDLGVSPNGGGIRALPQKTLQCALRNAEYGTRDVTYALIPELGEKTYKRFLLATGGKDWNGPLSGGVSTLLKDAALNRIATGLNVDNCASRATLVYVNGDYWGIHYLRESVDKHGLAMRHGLDADNLDILAHKEDSTSSDVVVERVDGEASALDDYQQFLNRMQSADLSTAAGLAVAEADMDVDNYLDYVIVETFFANGDWPIENCTFWRTHTNETAVAGGDGRWRWRLSGLDLAGMNEEGALDAKRDMLAFLASKPQKDIDEPGFLINRLWKNPDFRDRFVARYTQLLNTAFHPSRTAAVVRECAAEIADEVERHNRRWGRDITRAQWTEAVESSLVAFLEKRWRKSFDHLDDKFRLGGVGDLELACDVGGDVAIDGMAVSAENWQGRFFGGQTVTLAASAKVGYDFAGWSDGVTTPTRTVMVAKDGRIAVKALFQPGTTPCDVRFDPNGGTGTMDPLHFIGPQEQNLPANTFRRGGFLFAGWALTPDGAVAFGDGAKVCALTIAGGADVTLYAVWSLGRLYPAEASSGIAAGEVAPWMQAAAVYDGYVHDAKNGVHGTLTVKVSKANRRSRVAKVSAIFVPADGSRKCKFRNGKVGEDGMVGEMAAEGRVLRLALGTLGMSGTLGSWSVDGARNLFLSKNAAEKSQAAGLLPRFQPGCAFAWRESAGAPAPGEGWSWISAVVGTKGKVRISGTTASGVRAAGSGQFLVGAEHCCVPVVVVKKTKIAFSAWAGNSGWSSAVDVFGSELDVVAGGIGGNFAGTFDECVVPAPFALGPKGYEGWKPRVTAKNGKLKGSFKVYATVNGKAKKFSAMVNGVVIDGTGYGTAVVKKNVSWAVLLR